MVSVSVVIPFYSRVDWLIEALDSVAKQTYPVKETIVIDDGSSEDISYLEDSYPTVTFLFQENRGAAAARNKGIDASTGEIIMFLDSDDVWMPEKVEKQVRYMEQRRVQWSVHYYETVGLEKNKLVAQPEYAGLGWKRFYNTISFQTSTVAIRREALGRKRFAVDMRNGQDVYLWFKMANEYELGVLPECLSLYRMRGSNVASSYLNHIRVRGQLWKKMISGDLLMPDRLLTILGYRICYSMYRKGEQSSTGVIMKDNKFNLICFAIAWSFFRLDNKLQSWLPIKNDLTRKEKLSIW